MSDIVVELRGVSKRFGSVTAVDALSLEIRRGEFFSLLGPSGCGKTTTLRLLAGLETADGGTIRLAGNDVTRARPYERPVGMVFQNYALFPHLDVARNVAFGLVERRLAPAEIERRVARALEQVRLDPVQFRSRKPSELSGGQRQRVALARALVLEPAILLLDEPLGALDLQLRKEMQLELKALNRSLGITFVLVTHDQEEALVMSDRIAVMNHARVAQIGSPAEIYERPRTAFVAGFIGACNIFARQENGAPRRIAVRPEHVDLRAHTDPATDRFARGTVRDVVYLGETMHVVVRLDDGTDARVALRNEGQLRNPLARHAGDIVAISWNAADETVLEDQ